MASRFRFWVLAAFGLARAKRHPTGGGIARSLRNDGSFPCQFLAALFCSVFNVENRAGLKTEQDNAAKNRYGKEPSQRRGLAITSLSGYIFALPRSKAAIKPENRISRGCWTLVIAAWSTETEGIISSMLRA